VIWPDLVVRVFSQKVKALIDIVKKGFFGGCMATVYTIEFQKRGLSHIHLLIFTHPNSRVKEANDVDKFISAQIPNPETHPKLYDLVTKHMVHGPCGLGSKSPCIVNNQCSKKYPKTFHEATTLSEDGYANYARPNNGRTHELSRGRGIVDNLWIVPYNPTLLLTSQCHMNVECCISIQSTKYIHKYVYKGHDYITMGYGEQKDEITHFLNCCYHREFFDLF
jgi:hypothetical protein